MKPLFPRINKAIQRLFATKSQARSGFTLIELMIVVAIISILSAIAIPQFANLAAKSQERVTKVNLDALRSALAIYYGDNEGEYPTDMASLVPRYLNSIPMAVIPPHS